MSAPDLRALLVSAVEEAERGAAGSDPVLALRAAQRDRRQRRGHLAVLAFVAFVLLLQLLPANAFGAYGPSVRQPVAQSSAPPVTREPAASVAASALPGRPGA